MTVTADVPSAAAAVIAVKPPDVPAVTAVTVAAGARRILSIAAGVSIAVIEAAAGPGVAVVRAMPNTPALVGAGASAIAGGASAVAADLAWASDVLGAVGTVDVVTEGQLDAVTALTGSGPAYVFLVAEALIDAAVAAGLRPPLATRMTTQLLVGSAALLAERGDAPALRAMVTSPGGTTAAGLPSSNDTRCGRPSPMPWRRRRNEAWSCAAAESAPSANSCTQCARWLLHIFGCDTFLSPILRLH